MRAGIPTPGGVWADLGAGTGAFTLALAELIGLEGQIYAVDQDRAALHQAEQSLHTRFPGHRANFLVSDFTRPLDLPKLDGIVMANSLHFLRHKERLLQTLRAYLRPEGCFILVEYNVDVGNLWVPFPLSYRTWEQLASQCGFRQTRLLSTHPSRFLKEIYSAVSLF